RRSSDLRAVAAGIMLSSSGKARLPPMPRNIVRREIAFFEMNTLPPNLFRGGAERSSAPHDTHAERRTIHHTQNNRRPAIVRCRCIPRNLSDRGQVVILGPAPD